MHARQDHTWDAAPQFTALRMAVACNLVGMASQPRACCDAEREAAEPDAQDACLPPFEPRAEEVEAAQQALETYRKHVKHLQSQGKVRLLAAFSPSVHILCMRLQHVGQHCFKWHAKRLQFQDD